MFENENYLTVPYFILRNKSLKLGERLVLCEIIGLARQNGYCYAGNKYIAEKLGVSERLVSESVTKLKKLGFVKAKNTHTKIRQLIPDYKKLESTQNSYDMNADFVVDERKKRSTTTTKSAYYNKIYNKKEKENNSAQNSCSGIIDPHKPSYDISVLEKIQ